MKELPIVMGASPTRACVVGALAPYNHGLPLAGATLVELLAIRLSTIKPCKSLVIPRRERGQSNRTAMILNMKDTK
jgi:hypothetical protein